MPTLLTLLANSLKAKKCKQTEFTLTANSGAFTLIEILITIGIITMIAAVVLPNLRYFNQSEGLTIAKAALFDDLRLSKSKADSGTVCPGSPISVSSLQIIYAVELRQNGYYLKYQCVNTTSTPPIYYPTPNPAPYKPFPVSTNVRITNLTNSQNSTEFCPLNSASNYATLTFRGPGSCPDGATCSATEITCTTISGTTTYAGPPPVNINLTNSLGQQEILSVSLGGSIYEN